MSLRWKNVIFEIKCIICLLLLFTLNTFFGGEMFIGRRIGEERKWKSDLQDFSSDLWEERLFRVTVWERLMRSRTWMIEMEWESWALKVAAGIKFNQREPVVECFIWKQWSWSKWGCKPKGEPFLINNVSCWSQLPFKEKGVLPL